MEGKEGERGESRPPPPSFVCVMGGRRGGEEVPAAVTGVASTASHPDGLGQGVQAVQGLPWLRAVCACVCVCGVWGRRRDGRGEANSCGWCCIHSPSP